MVFTCYATFDTDVWIDDAAKTTYIISKSAKTGLIMSKGRNSSVKKMFFFSFWYSRPKATWSLKFFATTLSLHLTYLGNNAHFFIVKLHSETKFNVLPRLVWSCQREEIHWSRKCFLNYDIKNYRTSIRSRPKATYIMPKALYWKSKKALNTIAS